MSGPVILQITYILMLAYYRAKHRASVSAEQHAAAACPA